MSQKNNKKMRQLFRKEYSKTARELADSHMRILKPKPVWMPRPVWVFLLKMFIIIK